MCLDCGPEIHSESWEIGQGTARASSWDRDHAWSSPWQHHWDAGQFWHRQRGKYVNKVWMMIQSTNLDKHSVWVHKHAHTHTNTDTNTLNYSLNRALFILQIISIHWLAYIIGKWVVAMRNIIKLFYFFEDTVSVCVLLTSLLLFCFKSVRHFEM